MVEVEYASRRKNPQVDLTPRCFDVCLAMQALNWGLDQKDSDSEDDGDDEASDFAQLSSSQCVAEVDHENTHWP